MLIVRLTYQPEMVTAGCLSTVNVLHKFLFCWKFYLETIESLAEKFSLAHANDLLFGVSSVINAQNIVAQLKAMLGGVLKQSVLALL